MRKSTKSGALNDPIYDVVKGYAIYGKAKFKTNVSTISNKRTGTADG